MKNSNSVIVGLARTPIGSFQGSISNISAVQLGALVIKEAVKRASLNSDQIDEVIMGNVLSAGLGQAPARQASIYGGLPKFVQCMTINKVCGSGLKAVMLADQAIQCESADIIVAGGMENMSQSPHYIINSRKGMKLGHQEIIDSMIMDGLWDPYERMHMGNCAEVLSKEKTISRKEQDAFAKESYKKSLFAIENNLFKDEIIPVEVINKKSSIIIDTDEEPGRGKIDKFANLKPAFQKEGTITAANASSLNDGAAALVVMSQLKADSLEVQPICRIIKHVSIAHDPLYFTTAPSKAIDKVLKESNLLI